jgi:acetyl esterase
MKISGHIERAVLRRMVSLPLPLLRAVAGPRVLSPAGPALDVEAQLLLRIARLVGQKEGPDIGVRAARAQMEDALPIVDFRRVPARMYARTIPGPRGEIPIRIYHPRARRSPRPILVYFHGGGFVVGSVASYDGLCRELARQADAIVISVEYALAPEHRFPAGVEDALAATRWVIAEATSLGGDALSVAIGGDSAGGNLAAVVAQLTLGDVRRPVFQLLVYPATDLTRSFPSHRLFAEGYLLTGRSMDWYIDNYVTGDRDKIDPRGSPLFAADLRGLPPALVMTAGFDPLRDEGRAYAEKMKAAGVEVEYRCIEGSIHGFFSFGGVFSHARRAVEDAALALRSAFARSARARG